MDKQNDMPEEMNKLRKMLDDMGIEWQDMSTILIMDYLVENLSPIDLTMFRTHFSYNGVRISVICGHGSYGGEEGLLEMWNGQDDPEGYLTAEDIIKILKGERE